MTVNQGHCNRWYFSSILDNAAKTELIFQIKNMLICTFINQLLRTLIKVGIK